MACSMCPSARHFSSPKNSPSVRAVLPAMHGLCWAGLAFADRVLAIHTANLHHVARKGRPSGQAKGPYRPMADRAAASMYASASS